MIMDLFRVTGKVAVVTGAGRGLGAAAAVALAQAGADVVISARSADQLAGVAAEIEAAGRRALAVPADLSDLDAAAGLAGAAADAFGRLDIVVNNVGGAMPRPFPATKPRHLEAAFHFNVSVAHALTQAAIPYLLAAPREGVPAGAAAGERAGAGEGGSAGAEKGVPAGAVRPWRTTPGWPPPTLPPGSGSTRSPSAPPRPRRWTSCSPTTACAGRWNRRPRCAGSVRPKRSRPRWSSLPRQPPVTSPERSSRWTAELSAPISTSAFPTFN